MKTSLSHLPQAKQEQVLQVTELIKEVAAPEMIILFGSYANGTWVEDRYTENGIRYEYISDYDFLVVTENREEKDYILTDKIVNRSQHLTNVAVNPIIHEIDYVNEGLSIGQYFFTDIIKDGVVLYDTQKVRFAAPRLLTAVEQKKLADGYFEEWFESGAEFIDGANFYSDRGSNKKAIFLLHQATEALYNTILLVFTGYKPKTHSLEKLRQYTKPLSEELFLLFPIETDNDEKHLFDLLKRGYIDARYKHDYVMTGEELTELIERVSRMRDVVEKICGKKIDTF